MNQTKNLLEKTEQFRKKSIAASKKARAFRPSEKANRIGQKIGFVVDLLVLLGGIVLFFFGPLWGLMLAGLGLISLLSSFFFFQKR